MGFLNWWQKQQDDAAENPNSEEQGLTVVQKNLAKKGNRVDTAITNQMMRHAIHNKGGSPDCQMDCSVALSQELFDLNPKQVYEVTGGKPYDRSTLPPEVQAAWMAGEVIATHGIESSDIYYTAPDKVDNQLKETTRACGKATRKWFKW